MKAMSLVVFFCAGLLFCSGCGGPRRAPVEIIQERQRLPTLFFTEKTNQPVIAPGDKLMLVDPKTKELAWPAHECANPNCPGRNNGVPFLFIRPLDVGYFVKEDDSIGHDPEKSRATPPYHGCPECVKIRHLGTETPEEKALYNSFDKLHELPKSVKRRAQLDQELKEAMAVDPAKK